MEGDFAGTDVTMTPAEFVEAWARYERLGANLAIAARRLESSGEWALDGSVSMAAWLRHHCRMSNREAVALVHRARFLDRFPAIAEAASTGVLSTGQVQALKASCPPVVEPIMEAQQADVVAIVASLSVADTAVAAQAWRSRAEALVDTPEPIEPTRELRTAVTADGIVGNFVLDTAGAAQFLQAIRTASTFDGKDDVRPAQRRSADALVDICAFFNVNHAGTGTRRHRPHVELYVDADTLTVAPHAITSDNILLDTATTEAFLCDCVLHRVARAENAILSYGRDVRTVPITLFRAVAARDRGCRYPGCDRPVASCDAHHIHYWYNMGLTDLENLALFCSRHHHHIHRHGLGVKLLADATIEVTMRDGTVRRSRPRARPPNGP